MATTKRALILQLLTEGMGINAVTRVVGCSKNTVLKLLADTGRACSDYQDRVMVDLPCTRLQADEIWSFVYAKGRNAPTSRNVDAGDVWTWVAICEDTKLIPTWLIGDRTYHTGSLFMRDLALRINHPITMTTDGLPSYVEAVEDAFGGWMVDHQILKRTDPTTGTTARTSYVERQNLTMRMNIRRYARRTNAFSKKLANHAHAVALHFMVYNFCRPHLSLDSQTPAQAAGITSRQWVIEDILGLVDSN